MGSYHLLHVGLYCERKWKSLTYCEIMPENQYKIYILYVKYKTLDF